jgi:serine/threonine protein kinase
MAGLDDYEIGALLGRGAFAETFSAIHRPTGRAVALKRLRVKDAPDWKAIELFIREGETLAGLDHPGIARYVEAFAAEDGQGGEIFHLAQEKVEGENLATALARGETCDPAACAAFLRELGTTLSYLHGRRPAVIHRDLKPSNIMVRRAPGPREPRHVLIDFGALQRALPPRDGSAGSTIIGTSGYMPTEQLMGRTEPASDLYALGATAAQLLTGVAPAEMHVRRLRLDWRAHLPRGAAVPDWLGAILDDLLAPAVEDRIPTAEALLKRLDAGPRAAAAPAPPQRTRRAAIAAVVALVSVAALAAAAFVTARTSPDPSSGGLSLDIVAEDAHPTDLPVRVMTEPSLARHLGEDANPFGAAFHITPRSFSPGRYAAAGFLLENRSQSGWADVKAAVRLVDSGGDTLALKDVDLVAGYEGALEPGDVIGRGVHWSMEEAASPAGIEVLVTAAERHAPTPVTPTAPIEVEWGVPPWPGIALSFNLLSELDEARGMKDRRVHLLRLAVENVVERPVRTLKLQKHLVDPAGKVAPVVKDSWAIPHGAPSLLPGERRVVTLWSWEDAALTEWSLSVRDIGAGTRR